MRVAVPATGPEEAAGVDARFGRAAYFLVYDTEARAWDALVNSPDLQAVQGAGIQSAELLARSGVDALVTPHCGPKAFRVLQAAGVVVHLGTRQTARETVDACLAGEIPAASDADVAGHW
jgi:predicted Fe-Mo cluster-binding NifX family protein